MTHMPQQDKNLVIYKASAGSGKTYTLTKFYLRALLSIKNPDTGKYILNHPELMGGRRLFNLHRNILAITFTNKATDEMKDRIVTELKTLVENTPQSAYYSDFTALFGCTQQQLAQAAKTAMGDLMGDYGFFNVSTIDSFFQRVVRIFAHELDHQGDYQVVIDTSHALQSAITQMFEAFNESPDSPENIPVGKWLHDFITDALQSGRNFNVMNEGSKPRRELEKAMGTLFDERFKAIFPALTEFIGDPEKINRFRQELIKMPQRLLAEIKDLAANVLEQIPQFTSRKPNSNFTKFITKVAEGLYEPSDSKNKQHNAKYFTIPLETGNAETVFNAGDKKPIPAQLNGIIIDFLKKFSDYLGQIKAATAIVARLTITQVISLVIKQLKTFRKENNIMLLADTNDLLRRIIGQGEDLPFIYERLGTRLSHFLIDEFQDTSSMQWENLRPLIAESLSKASENNGSNDSLIIGDVKQAIYRFRNSDSTMLQSTVENVDFPWPEQRTVKGTLPAENTNWRSAHCIVQFNNTLFSRLPAQLNVKGYESVVQTLAPKTAGLSGYVRFFPDNAPGSKSQKNTDKETAEPAYAPGTTPSGTSKIAEIQMPKLVAEIHRQLGQGYLENEIAVICNANEEVRLVVETLIANGFNVLSDDGLLIRNSPAVRTIVSLLTLISRAPHVMAPTHLQDTPRHQRPQQVKMMISRFEYYYHRNPDDAAQALFNALKPATGQESPDPSGTLDQMIQRIMKRHPATLLSLVQAIMHEQLSPQQCREESAYIGAFLDVVSDYAKVYGNDLAKFLKWWNVKADKITVTSPNSVRAIQVCTIHSSKGLEYDCLHVPFASWKVNGLTEHAWVPMPQLPALGQVATPSHVQVTLSSALDLKSCPLQSDYLKNLREKQFDILNKTYVAFTRAKRELCVYYTPGKEYGKEYIEAFTTPGKIEQCDPALTLDLSEAYNPETGELTVGAPTNRDDDKSKDKDLKKDVEKARNLARQKDLERELKTKLATMTAVERLSYEGVVLASIDEDPFTANPPSISETRKLVQVVSIDSTPSGDISDLPQTPNTSSEDYPGLAPAEVYNARIRGEAMHFALAQIEASPLPANDPKLEKGLRRAARFKHLSPELTMGYLAELRSALSSGNVQPFIKQWFNDVDFVRNECVLHVPDAYLPDGGKSADGLGRDLRPDRIVFHHDGSIEIIDYKFTTAPHPGHAQQVKQYLALMRTAYPDRSIKAWLWYVDKNKIIPVE